MLFTVLLVSAVLVLYIISSKTENEASKLPETSLRNKHVRQESKESYSASPQGLKTGK